MDASSYEQLLPASGRIGAQSFVASLGLHHADPAVQRPYTIVNFVASVDGHATIGDQSGELSDPGDRELFRALRERADAVLIGTGTLASENYGRMLVHAERRERRLAAALSAEPLVVTITRSGRLPLEIRLFSEPEARIVVFSPVGLDTDRLAATVAHDQTVDPSGALHVLYRDYGVRTLLCEGGPTLFGALIRAGLVDELFLTVAPVLVGGASGPAVVSGPPPEAPANLELTGVLEREGTLFLRYRFSGTSF